MADAANLSIRKTEKLLTKSIKHVLSDNNINASTRSGNKELGILVKKLASAPFESTAAVEKLGSALGEKITQLSQQASKTDLDAGTVRSLSLKQDWMSEFDIPEANVKEKVSKKATKSEQTVVVPAKRKGQDAEPAPTPDPEPATDAEPTDAKTIESESAPTANDASSEETAEVVLPEEAAEVSEAAEAEVIEEVAAGSSGVGTATAAPADPVAAVNEMVTEEE
ncbi:MAG: hypothetical protein AAFO84_02325 [Cyanobacteria bacterium J06598_1]